MLTLTQEITPLPPDCKILAFLLSA